MATTWTQICSHPDVRRWQKTSPAPIDLLDMPSSRESKRNASAADLNRSTHDCLHKGDGMHQLHNFAAFHLIFRSQYLQSSVVAAPARSFSNWNKMNSASEIISEFFSKPLSYLFELMSERHSIEVIGVRIWWWRPISDGWHHEIMKYSIGWMKQRPFFGLWCRISGTWLG